MAAAAGFVALFASSSARADEPKFGKYDVETVFFISKSRDKNRVDYGMRLDSSCAPANEDAVFPYWRNFEKSATARTEPLLLVEYIPYGIGFQRTLESTGAGHKHVMRLRQFNRTITITTTKEANGTCSAVARTTIGGVSGAELKSVFVKLAGMTSVEYIDVMGKNPATGEAITEHIKR